MDSEQHSGDFEPSVTVRLAIIERLEQQQETLLKAFEHNRQLIDIGMQALNMDNTRSTGNKQVSGNQLQQVRARAAMGEDPGKTSTASKYGKRPKFGGFAAPYGPIQRGEFHSIAGEFSHRPMLRTDWEEEDDPIKMFQRLGREISILVHEFSKRGPGGPDWNPCRDRAEYHAALAEPKGALTERMMKIIGMPGIGKATHNFGLLNDISHGRPATGQPAQAINT